MNRSNIYVAKRCLNTKMKSRKCPGLGASLGGSECLQLSPSLGCTLSEYSQSSVRNYAASSLCVAPVNSLSRRIFAIMSRIASLSVVQRVRTSSTTAHQFAGNGNLSSLENSSTEGFSCFLFISRLSLQFSVGCSTIGTCLWAKAPFS